MILNQSAVDFILYYELFFQFIDICFNFSMDRVEKKEKKRRRGKVHYINNRKRRSSENLEIDSFINPIR